MNEEDGATMQNERSTRTMSRPARTLAVLGIAMVLFALFVLYRGERVNNREYMVSRAERVNPLNPAAKDGAVVKFSGIPDGDLVVHELSGKRFVYVDERYYQFERVKKEKVESDAGDGRVKTPKTYFENEWVFKNSKQHMAQTITIGRLLVRIREAELLGSREWTKTVYQGASRDPETAPVPGDKKYVLAGITADTPLFVAGRLQGDMVGAGDVFIASAFSEGKTLAELHDSLWFRKIVCFGIILAGLLLLIYPLMALSRAYHQCPVLSSLAKFGWGAYIIIALCLSYILVKFSAITVDLLWAALVLMIAIPLIVIIRKRA